MSNAERWERMDSELVADCRVFRVVKEAHVRLCDGKTSDFYVIDSPSWVNIVATTKDGEIIMIEQFRQGIGEMTLELPGGLVDDDESPLDAASRELREETGYTSPNWIEIGRSRPNPAIQSNTIYYFLADDCERTDEPSLDPDENVETKLIPETEIGRLVRNGIIQHSLVIAGFYYFEKHFKEA